MLMQGESCLVRTTGFKDTGRGQQKEAKGKKSLVRLRVPCTSQTTHEQIACSFAALPVPPIKCLTLLRERL